MTKWIISSFSFLIFAAVLFINLQNNSEINDEFNTNLANVTNEEMESVIDQNPDIHPMRMALANRYFDDLDYSQALPHFMYIAENSADNELKSFALAQIGWMVYESNNLDVATTYLNESLRINSESLVAKSYLGIIYIQDPAKQNEGLEILNSVIQSNKLSKEDRNFIVKLKQKRFKYTMSIYGDHKTPFNKGEN